LPKKFSKQQIEREKKELLAIKGMDKVMVDKLCREGIINAALFLEDVSAKLSAESSMAHVVQGFQKAIRKKRDTAVTQI
jgi:hypothetical protein